MICALPVAISGFVEDAFGFVSPVVRLATAILSAFVWQALMVVPELVALGWTRTGGEIGYLCLTLCALTIFVAGVSNAWNIVDGVNGLSAGCSVCAASAFLAISLDLGDAELTLLASAMIGTLAGFLLLNFPHGRIFLGDGGAYLYGFILAALAVALPLRHPGVSPVAGVLLLAYPIMETLFSIHRRVLRHGRLRPGRAFVADRLHLHSLLYRSVARRLASRLGRPEWRNPLTTLLILPLPAFCALVAVAFAGDSWICLGAVLVVLFGYISAYRRIALMRRRDRVQRVRRLPLPGGRPGQGRITSAVSAGRRL